MTKQTPEFMRKLSEEISETLERRERAQGIGQATCSDCRLRRLPASTQVIVLCQRHASLEKFIEAAKPLAHFIRQFDRKPIKTADDFYAIHTGTEWAAELRLSDLRALSEALASIEVRK